MTCKQHTLTGEETDEPRVRPDTLKKCYHCEEHVLRSRWDEHEEHDRQARQEISERIADEAEDEDDPEPEVIGEWFDVRVHKTVEYAFTIPAWDKHRAKELAKEWAWDAKPVDSYHVHTDIDSRGEITTGDVPDDFDPYGGTELWEVFEDDA